MSTARFYFCDWYKTTTSFRSIVHCGEGWWCDPGVGWWWGNSCFLSCGKQEEISWATNICIDYWIWTWCQPHSGYDAPTVAKISAFNGLRSVMLLPDIYFYLDFNSILEKIGKYGQRSILKYISAFIWFVENYKKKLFTDDGNPHTIISVQRL